MSGSHWSGPVVSDNGFNVGTKLSNRKIINSSGQIYMPKFNITGALQWTKKASTVTNTTTATAAATLSTSVKTTLTEPVHFYKAKFVAKQNATKKLTVTFGVNGSAVTTTKGTAKTITKTITKSVSLTGSPYFSVKAKGTSVSTQTLSLATLSIDQKRKVQFKTIT